MADFHESLDAALERTGAGHGAEKDAPLCHYSGLGIVVSEGMSNGVPIPNDRVFGARCACGAHVTVVDGRIPFHRRGIDERPPDEACDTPPAETGPDGGAA